MRSNRLLACIGVTASILLIPTTAMTANAARPPTEWNWAQYSQTAPTGHLVCSETANTRACFKPAGDVIWVKDKASDDRSSVLQWWDYPDNADGDWVRSGICVNTNGKDTWAYCNKDLPEDSSIVGLSIQYDLDDSNWYLPKGPKFRTRVG